MDASDLEQQILAFVGREGYKPVKPRVIAKRLGLDKEAAVELKRTIKRMVRRGQIGYGSNHLIEPATAALRKTNRTLGVFQRTQKGYGFVRPSRPLSAEEETPQDIFIPASKAADASSGDTVLVQLGKRRPGEPRLRGEIVEIVERQTNQFVGTYFERGAAGYVLVDGTLFTTPIYVGDPGAKDARPDDKVVFEMVRFPSPIHDGEGVIIEVLGARGTPGVDTLSVMREFGLPERFPEDAMAAAHEEATGFDEEDFSGRLDLTAELVITIDPIDARDFDDAISLARLEGGGWRLGVHIADVAHFVRPKTPLDREAYKRATSCYLPDRVVPMLPETISNSLASLQPGRNRYAKTVYIEYDADGLPRHKEFHASVICSKKRLAYEQVDEYLADREAGRATLGAEVAGLLDDMLELAMILRKRRFTRGALEMVMPEVKIDLDKQGRVCGAHVVEDTVSHQIIEEFMLAANETVAETIEAKGWPFLRRIHQAPSPHKLRALKEFAVELGYQVHSLESRFELQKLLHASADQPERHAVHFAVLRAMQRAVYGPAEEGHYALASDCYCHFTSPIRRYPDITIHRLLDAILAKRKPAATDDDLLMQGQHCSDREQRAEEAERELTKLKLLTYLSTRIGEEMDVVVTGVESWGLFLQGVELPAEGLLHVEGLPEDCYTFDRVSHTLAGRRAGNLYRLGDLMRVAVARVDLERRELDFRLLERKPAHRTKGEPPAKIRRRKEKDVRSEKKGRRSKR